jgi:hypothetical protein
MPDFTELDEKIALKTENDRLRAELTIRKSGTERWLPCPDHRDKVDYANNCPQCQIEHLQTECDLIAAQCNRLNDNANAARAQNAELLAALERIARPGCGCKPVCRCNDSLSGALITIEGMRELAAEAIAKAKGEKS